MIVTLALILLLIILTLASGFFSGSEIALFSLSSAQVHNYKTHKDQRRRLIAHLLAHPRDLLITIYIFNTFVNILLQNAASTLFGALASWTLKVGVPLVIVLLLGEIIPKYIALQNNAGVSYFVSPIIAFFQDYCGPIRKFFTLITMPLSRLMFFFLKEEKLISRDELQHVLQESEERGIIHADEAYLMHGYLDLREALVKEVMRPREDIIAYDINQPLSKLIHNFVDLECSRIPVYREDLDNLLGIITSRDFFMHCNVPSTPNDIIPFLDKPFFVPETAPAPAVLRQLEEQNYIIALVVDEYGSISGLITKEDLVEEVIGEIIDRRDEKNRYTRAGDDVIIASGKLELDDFEDIFGIKLHSPNNMVTIGGWLTEQINDIPKSGAYYKTKDFLFHVLAADPNRVRRLYIRKLHPSHLLHQSHRNRKNED